MKLRSWVIGALIIAALVFGVRACVGKAAPDEKLAGHIEDMCDIARSNVKTPERGVRTIGRFLAKHLGDIFGEFGDTITTIELVADDDAHDARAHLAHDRLAAPLRACENDWFEFFEAVEADPEASELMSYTAERLDRTLGILLSGEQLDLKRLPHLLERSLDQAIDHTVR